MSTPMVAGVAALIKARDPSLNATQIKSLILNNVDTKSSFSNKVVSGGRLNASKAVQAVGSSPPTPNPTVTSITPPSGANNRSVSITSLAGTNFANGAIVHLTRSGSANITASGVTVVSPTKITCTFSLTGTTPGQYNVVVRNLNGKEGVLTNGFTINEGVQRRGCGMVLLSSGLQPDTGILITTSMGLSINPSDTGELATRSSRETGREREVTGSRSSGLQPGTGILITTSMALSINPSDTGVVRDQIIKGDWHGDGRDGIAIFRPSTGYWYFDYNLDGIVDKSFRYGGSTDQVIVGKWA